MFQQNACRINDKAHSIIFGDSPSLNIFLVTSEIPIVQVYYFITMKIYLDYLSIRFDCEGFIC